MKTSVHFRRPAAAVLVLLCVSCASTPAGPSAQQVFDQYVDAVHAGDMARIDQLISPKVERSDYVGCKPEMDNKACLLHYIQTTVVGVGGRIKTVSARTEADTVVAVLEVRSRLGTQMGVERIVGTDIVRVEAGQITAFKFVPQFADEQTAVFFGKLGIGPRAPQPAAKTETKP